MAIWMDLNDMLDKPSGKAHVRNDVKQRWTTSPCFVTCACTLRLFNQYCECTQVPPFAIRLLWSLHYRIKPSDNSVEDLYTVIHFRENLKQSAIGISPRNARFRAPRESAAGGIDQNSTIPKLKSIQLKSWACLWVVSRIFYDRGLRVHALSWVTNMVQNGLILHDFFGNGGGGRELKHPGQTWTHH